MNYKNTKVGLLVFILAVPTFLFLSAHFMGENHFDLPRLFPVQPIQLESKTVNGETITDTVYQKIGPFEFIDENGNSFSSDKLKGKITVASFIFTNCKLECTLITSNLTKLNQTFKEDDEVMLLSFTVDPDYDTPKKLLEYKSMYDIENPNWKFLGGKDKEYTYDVLQKQFYATAKEDSDKKVGFIHSQKVALIDQNGVIRVYYLGTDGNEIDELISAIKILKDAE